MSCIEVNTVHNIDLKKLEVGGSFVVQIRGIPVDCSKEDEIDGCRLFVDNLTTKLQLLTTQLPHLRS